jgi:hypothetical protein
LGREQPCGAFFNETLYASFELAQGVVHSRILSFSPLARPHHGAFIQF